MAAALLWFENFLDPAGNCPHATSSFSDESSLVQGQDDEIPDPNFKSQNYGLFMCVLAWFFVCTLIFAFHNTKPPLEWEVKKPRIPHMGGLRAIAAMQVVATHFLLPGQTGENQYHLEKPYLLGVVMRAGDCAVTFFILLSGFFTHYAYSHELKTGGVMIFWARRILRIFPVYYVAHFWSVWLVKGTYDEITPANNWGCIFFMSTWQHSISMTMPNRMLWTVVTLVWCWIWFPAIARFFHWLRPRMNPAQYSMKIFSVGVLVCAILAHLSTLWEGDSMSIMPYLQLKAYPPVVFTHFVAGVITAEALVYLPPMKRSYAFALITDATFFLWTGLWWVLPYFTKNEMGFRPEGFFVNGYVAVWAVFIYASCQAPHGLICMIARNRHINALGDYAFEIYCFQYPVFTAIRDYRQGKHDWYERVPVNEWTMCTVALIIFSIWFAEFIEFPYVKWLRKFCNNLGGVPEKRAQEIIRISQNEQKHAVPEEAAPLIAKMQEVVDSPSRLTRQVDEEVYEAGTMLQSVLAARGDARGGGGGGGGGGGALPGSSAPSHHPDNNDWTSARNFGDHRHNV